MWGSSHPGIQAALLRAMERNGLDWLFVPLATAHLERSPDDAFLRYRLALRLRSLARFEESAALWPVERRHCRTRDECLAAIVAAGARLDAGRADEARALLEAIRGDALDHDALSRWEAASAEVDGD